jgi:rRNA maturation RNase YbeY
VISFYLNKDYAEVFLAPSAIKINAHNFRAEFKEELYRCVVHGMLHVFGSKDETNKDKIRMWKKQEALLKKIIPYG